MAVFSTNQNRQFYVVDTVGTVNADAEKKTVEVKSTKKVDSINPEVYFLYKGADTVLKSDRIPAKGVSYIKLIKAEDLRTPLKSEKVTLDETVNGGMPVIGQDYILRIELRQFYGMSDEDVYFKEGAVHVSSRMIVKKSDGSDDAVKTKQNFYEAMVKSLNLSFSRETGATKDSNPYLTFTADADGITITEKPQTWTLGTETQEPVLFHAVPTTIYVDGADEIWGETDPATPTGAKSALVVEGVGQNAIGNGHKTADLEYFCMGERGDQYRLIGFPNYIPTTYLVDPNKEYNYLEIHYSFMDTGVESYKSDKDITIVTEKDKLSVLESVRDAILDGVGLKETTGK